MLMGILEGSYFQTYLEIALKCILCIRNDNISCINYVYNNQIFYNKVHMFISKNGSIKWILC